MPAADDIETRLAIVERDVTQLREQLALTISDAGAARMLAAGADHDVSEVRAELRAHTQALNALRETQLEQGREMREGFAEQGRRIDEQGQRIDEQGQKIDEQTRRIDEQGQKIDEQTRRIDEQTREMREGFATLATGMAQITTLLTNLAGTEGLR